MTASANGYSAAFLVTRPRYSASRLLTIVGLFFTRQIVMSPVITKLVTVTVATRTRTRRGTVNCEEGRAITLTLDSAKAV